VLVATLQAELVLLPVLVVVLVQVAALLPVRAVGQMLVPQLLVVVVRKESKALKLAPELLGLDALVKMWGL
jgi:hypothetical protein